MAERLGIEQRLVLVTTHRRDPRAATQRTRRDVRRYPPDRRAADRRRRPRCRARRAPSPLERPSRRGCRSGQRLAHHQFGRYGSEVSKRSALLAAAGASTGGLWSFLGPARGAAERALLPINGTALASVGLGAVAGRQAAQRKAPRRAPQEAWHELDPDESLRRLDTTSAGLEHAERERRHAASTARVSNDPVGLGLPASTNSPTR